MLALSSVDPRSCHVATTICEDTFGFDATPLLIALVALAVIGFVVTVILGYRRRRQLLRDHGDPTTGDPTIGDQPTGDEPRDG